ncbi:hypothetical protein ABR39_23200 [Enterobacter genomosp. O]|uniref:hypothetical protein n=1 Tax=Enterobacter genomosp. O TaxID=2364150 RepID=UPI000642AF4C|nr:hypothetical protein [Enterobacter genomosp. O]KLP53513.1 hypothetical protein ABR39_23200 [Enterobacter genomosp. O]
MWKGIPFKLSEFEIYQSSNIVISKLPHIIIDSSYAWVSPLLSVLGALVGGAIPAYVAIKAIRANKEQMLHQQMIINRQDFIDKLRLKISIFTADVAKLSLFLNDEFTEKDIKFKDASEPLRKKFLDIIHALDREYNYVELMIGGEPRFQKILKLMDEIVEGISNILHESANFDVFHISDKLTQETIRCIEHEWQLVTSVK